MQYRRAKNPGSSYFFTLVTHNRRSILCEPENIDLLRDSFKRVVAEHPFCHGMTLQLKGLRTQVDPHWKRGLSYLKIG